MLLLDEVSAVRLVSGDAVSKRARQQEAEEGVTSTRERCRRVGQRACIPMPCEYGCQ